jgi:AcrR family transcriptional regulator
MTGNKVVSREEWIAARKELLTREKESTRLRDELAAERRALPWVKTLLRRRRLGFSGRNFRDPAKVPRMPGSLCSSFDRIGSSVLWEPASSRCFRGGILDLIGPFSLTLVEVAYILVGMRVAARKRNPDLTRENLLQAAFWEMYRNGFRAADLDTILAQARVTKGALYHHFESKAALGHAVIDEVVHNLILDRWLRPLERVEDPIRGMIEILRGFASEKLKEACEFGCPLNNLAQEMSPVDAGFREKIHRIYRLWRDGLTNALRRGQENGYVRSDIDPAKVGAFIVAALEGGVGLAKNAQDPDLLLACGQSLVSYLESLRPAAAAR